MHGTSRTLIRGASGFECPMAFAPNSRGGLNVNVVKTGVPTKGRSCGFWGGSARLQMQSASTLAANRGPHEGPPLRFVGWKRVTTTIVSKLGSPKAPQLRFLGWKGLSPIRSLRSSEFSVCNGRAQMGQEAEGARRPVHGLQDRVSRLNLKIAAPLHCAAAFGKFGLM
jgi:hypothetical protein